jgi:hypothetical protein
MSDTPPKHAAEAALVQQLARIQRLHAERAANPILAGALQRLGDWQSRRLGQTYADLAAQPRYRDAIAFFQSDLYGNEEMAKRDSDVARVVPLLVAMLPERVIATIAQAMELNVVSHELDRVLLARLPRATGSFDVAEYCRAFRRAGNLPARRRQIALLVEVGRSLDVFVRKPMIRGALKMMRRPARLAGYASLHDFLERGFAAFRRMEGAEEFLATIETRETAILEAIVDGSNDPFPDPLNRLGVVRPPASGAQGPST